MEFEQMLQEAEEPTITKSAQDTPTTSTDTADQPPQPRRKAKTKIGNKSKKKKKVKNTSKPDGEEQYEVQMYYFVNYILFKLIIILAPRLLRSLSTRWRNYTL